MPSTITSRPASEPGALAGWVARCGRCGDEQATSLETEAPKLAAAHERWHETRDGAAR